MEIYPLIDERLCILRAKDRCEQLLRTLRKMGFSKERCVRALSATGFHSSRLAIFWLCSHHCDPMILSDFVMDLFIMLCLDGGVGLYVDETVFVSNEVSKHTTFKMYFPGATVLHIQVSCSVVPDVYNALESLSDHIRGKTRGFDFSWKLHADAELCILGYDLSDSGANDLRELTELLCTTFKQRIPTVRVVNEWTGSSSPAITLVRNFQPDQLQSLIDWHNTRVGSKVSVGCSLRLYSQDPRLRDHTEPEIYETLTSWESSNHGPSLSTRLSNNCCLSNSNLVPPRTSPATNDPNKTDITPKLLEYHVGDHILLLDSCSLPDRQGCPFGLNLNTGATGVFDLQSVKRIPQYKTWVFHGSIPLQSRGMLICSEQLQCEALQNNQMSSRSHSVYGFDLTETNSSPRCRQPSQQSALSSPVEKSLKDAVVENGCKASSSSPTCSSVGSVASCTVFSPDAINDPPVSSMPCWIPAAYTSLNCTNPLLRTGPPSTLSPGGDVVTATQARSSELKPSKHRTRGRQLFIMRHAERVDACFGRGWITQCFDKKGVYRRFNLNLPPWLPPRSNHLEFALDSPITQVGLFVSAELGRNLVGAGVRFSACYCSPSLRCVQTACELLRAMGHTDLLIRIEPLLFEWLGWYTTIPTLMTAHELKSCGYPIDVNYTPIGSLSDCKLTESIAEYFERSNTVVKRLLAAHKTKDSCLLVVAHASSLKACTHRLLSRGFRSGSITQEEFQHYTTIVPYCALVVAEERLRWTLIDPPSPSSCSHSHNSDFDGRQLLNTTFCGFRIH